MAFVMMFTKTCSRRTASPSTHTGSARISMCRSSPAFAVTLATARCIASAMSSGWRSNRIFPRCDALDVKQVVDEAGEVARPVGATTSRA